MQVLSGSSLQIDLDKRNQDTKELRESLNVIAVPEMRFSEKFDSVIQLPTDESTRVRIHLNRKMQTGYDLRDESNDPAPVISSRDVRFMKLQTTGAGLLKFEEKKNSSSFDGNGYQIASMKLSGSNALDSDQTVGKRAFEGTDQTMIKRFKW